MIGQVVGLVYIGSLVFLGVWMLRDGIRFLRDPYGFENELFEDMWECEHPTDDAV